MTLHPALNAGRVAVITGAASGIGLAAAVRFASMGLKVCLADLSSEALDRASEAVAAAVCRRGGTRVLTVATDVSRLESVQALRDAVYARFGEVGVLMNNAGTAPGRRPVGAHRPLAPRAGGQPVGRHQWRADFYPADAGAANRVCHRQYRVEAGHHLPAG